MTIDCGPIAVLGAGGFIGRHLVLRLEASGMDVIVPTEPGGGRLDIAGPVDHIVRAIAGAEVVVNAAGRAHLHTQDPSRFWASNTTGAGRVAEAVASSPQVKRLVHVSSVAVGSGGLAPHAIDQAPFTAYGASKAAGEIAVAAALKGSATELVVVRPAGIGGPDSPGSWGTIRRRVEAGKRVPVPANDVRYDVVEIDEVVDFMVASIRGEVPAGVHSVSGHHPVTLAEYAEAMGRAAGTRARVLRVPVWALRSAAASVSALQRTTAPATRVEQLVSTLTEQRPLVARSPVGTPPS